MIFRPSLNLSDPKSRESIFQLNSFSVLIMLAIACFFFGISVGINTSSFSLFLAKQMLTTSDITKILSSEIVGYIIIAPFIVVLSSKIGIQNLVIISLALRNFFLGIFCFSHDIILWQIGMLGFGIFGFALYTCIFGWVNSLAEEGHRATYLSIASLLFGLGIATGPLLLAFFEIEVGETTFKISIAMSFLMCLPIFAIHDSNKIKGHSNIAVKTILKYAYIPLICSIATEYAFFATTEFLPLYVLYDPKFHYSPYVANGFLGLTNIIFVIPIGIILDRFDRIKTILVSAAGVTIFIQLLPYVKDNLLFGLIAISIFSGCLNGIILGALAILGDKFRGEDIMSSNSIIHGISAIGGYAGISCTGNAISTLGPSGFVYSITSLFLVLLALLLIEIIRNRPKR